MSDGGAAVAAAMGWEERLDQLEQVLHRGIHG